MVKAKIIEETSQKKLEQSIEMFYEHHNVLDIKFSSANNSNKITFYSVLIIYDDEQKRKIFKRNKRRTK